MSMGIGLGHVDRVINDIALIRECELSPKASQGSSHSRSTIPDLDYEKGVFDDGCGLVFVGRRFKLEDL